MSRQFVAVNVSDGIAEVVMARGKVNALDLTLAEELTSAFEELAQDDSVHGVVLTGTGPFFSFGFDIPEYMPASRDEFRRFLVAFNGFAARLYGFPKPVVAALNGHAVAGGCILALACDYRIMTGNKARIGLNEVSFGSSIFASSVAMLCSVVGHRRAETVLLTGALYDQTAALELGLVDAVEEASQLMTAARERATALGANSGPAFAGLKQLLRGPIIETMTAAEPASIEAFLDIWYSPEMRQRLEQIKIRD